jgi:hypothetical protein
MHPHWSVGAISRSVLIASVIATVLLHRCGESEVSGAATGQDRRDLRSIRVHDGQIQGMHPAGQRARPTQQVVSVRVHRRAAG